MLQETGEMLTDAVKTEPAPPPTDFRERVWQMTDRDRTRKIHRRELRPDSLEPSTLYLAFLS